MLHTRPVAPLWSVRTAVAMQMVATIAFGRGPVEGARKTPANPGGQFLHRLKIERPREGAELRPRFEMRWDEPEGEAFNAAAAG